MFVHLGSGCLIRTADIIGIFSAKENKEILNFLKNKKGECYKVENLSEDGMTESIILTDKNIFLSAISVLTLQKRIQKHINQVFIFHNGGNNG